MLLFYFLMQYLEIFTSLCFKYSNLCLKTSNSNFSVSIRYGTKPHTDLTKQIFIIHHDLRRSEKLETPKISWIYASTSWIYFCNFQFRTRTKKKSNGTYMKYLTFVLSLCISDIKPFSTSLSKHHSSSQIIRERLLFIRVYPFLSIRIKGRIRNAFLRPVSI